MKRGSRKRGGSGPPLDMPMSVVTTLAFFTFDKETPLVNRSLVLQVDK